MESTSTTGASSSATTSSTSITTPSTSTSATATTSASSQILINLAENIADPTTAEQSVRPDSVLSVPDHEQPSQVNIKQEFTGDTLEITDLLAAANAISGAATAAAISTADEEGTPISIDEFVHYHNQQVEELRKDVSYLTKCFELMYKYKSVADFVVEDYFKADPHFKYKNVIDDLETDLIALIGEDEDRYQTLLGEINTDVVLTEEDQIEFAEGGGGEEDDTGGYGDPSGKFVQLVNGVEVPFASMRKLPGQRPADAPECPACGFRARCRLKLEAHILEHVDNPLVVCNHDGCEMPFEIHRLFQHEKDYHPEVQLTCEMCNEMFDSRTMLIQHYKQHIRRKEKLQCNLCDYKDIYVGRMDRHKQTVHGVTITKQFKCDFEGCGRIFKDRPSFYTHSLIHKDKSLVYKHKCSYEGCDAVFKRRRNLMVHMLKHGNGRRRYNCNISGCKRTYSRERELQRHIELVHRGNHATRSALCIDDSQGDIQVKKEFDTESVMELVDGSKDDSAMDTTEPGDTTDFEADTGADTTGNETQGENIIYVKNLNDQNVTTVNVISCEDLDNSANSGEHVIEMDENGNTSANGKLIVLLNKNGDGEHMELLSNSVVGEILCEGDATLTDECELCTIKFSTSAEMISHLKERHHQYTIRAYRCDFDGCTFATHFRSILGKHKNTVHGGKYKCEVCGKLSKDSGNHNRHRNIHKNVVFRCRYENCEAVYKSPKAYYVHVLTHSNEQPVYKCDFAGCKYITYYMNTLNVHKLTHSDVRNFFCPYEQCGKGFKRNGDLNKHITHSHKGVKRPQKKRKLNDGQVLYRCTWTNCSFTFTDHVALHKHEEEHAATAVEKYKFEDAEEVEEVE